MSGSELRLSGAATTRLDQGDQGAKGGRTNGGGREAHDREAILTSI